MARDRNSNFWISYADLMTSLFFVMLVLFIVVVAKYESDGKLSPDEIARLRKENKELREKVNDLEATNKKLQGAKEASDEQLTKLIELFNVQEKIDKQFFTYDETFKRFTLTNFAVKFDRDSFNIANLPQHQRQKLLDIGESLKQTFNKAQKDPATKDAQYLLIVEGQASKDNYSGNDVLSYRRALSLVKYWNKNISFPSNCEIIISGSGQSSKFRDNPDTPPANQRFVIHIVPKPGKMPEIKK